MSNLQAMTHKELKRYVLANRHDREAIELLAQQTRDNPNLKTYQPEDIDRLPEILGIPDRENIA